VLINGLQHFLPTNVKSKLQIVDTFIKAYYLPETEASIKEISFDQSSRAVLQAGIDKFADAVGLTLGPRG
ncbi:unnamed protein product, partial [Brassica oleracea var. botrytis]